MSHKTRRDKYRRTLLCQVRVLRRSVREVIRHFEPPIAWCLGRLCRMLEWTTEKVKRRDP